MMNSFFDQPRPAPIPSDKVQLATVVPEVSIIFDSKNNSQDNSMTFTHTQNNLEHLSYNAWRSKNKAMHNNVGELIDARKQVRFENQNPQLCNVQPPIDSPPTFQPKTKPFEEIYIANIPNRHLDLSLIETPTVKGQAKSKIVENKKMELQTSKKENINPHVNYVTDKMHYYNFEIKPNQEPEPVINMFDYKSKESPLPYGYHLVNQCRPNLFENCEPKRNLMEMSTQTNENSVPKHTNESNEPTMKDLLKIIQQQNEQLLILQKQVSALISNKDLPKIETSCEEYATSTQHERIYNPPEKKLLPKSALPKFSIDVMTSFEVSIKPQPKFQKPKIQEIFESKNDAVNVLHGLRDDCRTDVSLTLNEPLEIPEYCPSPEHVVEHVDMKDFSSDSDDDSSSSDIGWTFYNNVMGQVNNILQNANREPSKSENDVTKEKIMKKVKAATAKHLQNIGVNLSPIDDADESDGSSSSSEISFAVKQLLMKYLPNEELAKITLTQKQNIPKEQINLRRPEFSFASLQHMKKYNLIGGNNVQQNKHFLNQPRTDNSPKILDITALKRQPKLM